MELAHPANVACAAQLVGCKVQAIGAWFTRPENATLLLLATSLPQFFTAGFAWPREAIPGTAIALGRMFPADSAIDGLVRINQLGASIWEVARRGGANSAFPV